MAKCRCQPPPIRGLSPESWISSLSNTCLLPQNCFFSRSRSLSNPQFRSVPWKHLSPLSKLPSSSLSQILSSAPFLSNIPPLRTHPPTPIFDLATSLNKAAVMGAETFLEVILAILLPPVGVFLRHGCGVYNLCLSSPFFALLVRRRSSVLLIVIIYKTNHDMDIHSFFCFCFYGIRRLSSG